MLLMVGMVTKLSSFAGDFNQLNNEILVTDYGLL